MTIDDVRAALGTGRAAWVETTGSSGALAILVRAGRLGDAVLIRWADTHEGYHWTGAESLRRREDLDGGPEPAWLRRARASHRPPAVLWDVLNVRICTTELLDDPMQFEADADGRVQEIQRRGPVRIGAFDYVENADATVTRKDWRYE